MDKTKELALKAAGSFRNGFDELAVAHEKAAALHLEAAGRCLEDAEAAKVAGHDAEAVDECMKAKAFHEGWAKHHTAAHQGQRFFFEGAEYITMLLQEMIKEERKGDLDVKP